MDCEDIHAYNHVVARLSHDVETQEIELEGGIAKNTKANYRFPSVRPFYCSGVGGANV